MTQISTVAHTALRRRTWLGWAWACGVDPAWSAAQDDEATVLVEHIPSPALKRSMPALVYRPPGFTARRRYPVLYLYHGLRETHTFWRDLGVFDTATALINHGAIEPLLIVTPQLDNSFGVNNTEDRAENMPHGGSVTFHGGRYEDYLVNDVVDFIDAHHPTQAERHSRAVGGISMGGFAALHAAMRHPERFGRAGGHSPALIQDDWTWLYPPTIARAERDVLMLAQNRDLKGLRVYLDCGEQDHFGFFPAAQKLADILRSRHADAQIQLRPGQHNAAYWMSHLADYLRFYASR